MNIDQPEIRKTDEVTLESWKEIAEYLQRNTTTARRWEKEEGLPVHRHSHSSRSSVYAYPSEIDAWRLTRKLPAAPATLWQSFLTPAFGVTLLLCLIMVGNGVRGQVASAQQPVVQARRVWADAKGGGMVAISRRGRYIAFADWDTGNLSVHDLASGADRALTNTGGWKPSDPGWVEGGLVSPDESQVAYTWWSNKAPNYEIRIVPLGGAEATTPRIVRRNGEDAGMQLLDWSPDGKLLYVERRLEDSTAQLAVVSIRDGSLRVLKSLGWLAAQARLSPDGRYLAYDRPVGNAAPSSDIVLLASDGSQENVIVDHPAKDFAPMWSPDGSQVLFLSDRTGKTSLWRVPVENGKARGAAEMVKADVGAMLPLNIARDGTLFYRQGDGARRNIFFAEVDGDLKITKPPMQATERFVNSNFHPAWSPDGEYIAYYSRREGAYVRPLGAIAPEAATVLVIRSMRTGEERDIRLPLQVSVYRPVAEPKWFPDGRSILVVGWVSERPNSAYFRVDLASGKTEFLYRPQPEFSPLHIGRLDLSPDGKSIYFMDTHALKRFDIEARRESEVQKMVLFDAQIAISPDGKQIALGYRTGLDNPDTIAILPITGGEPRVVGHRRLGEDHPSTLAWTPDQRFLIYSEVPATWRPSPHENDKEPYSSSLWCIPMAGGEPRKLGVSVKGGDFSTLRVHPGGRRIVYETIEPAPDEVWALENFLPKTVATK